MFANPSARPRPFALSAIADCLEHYCRSPRAPLPFALSLSKGEQ